MLISEVPLSLDSKVSISGKFVHATQQSSNRSEVQVASSSTDFEECFGDSAERLERAQCNYILHTGGIKC